MRASFVFWLAGTALFITSFLLDDFSLASAAATPLGLAFSTLFWGEEQEGSA